VHPEAISANIIWPEQPPLFDDVDDDDDDVIRVVVDIVDEPVERVVERVVDETVLLPPLQQVENEGN
jgi:hypothetical protein